MSANIPRSFTNLSEDNDMSSIFQTIYTRDRSPSLNSDNFSSTQQAGYVAHAERLVHSASLPNPDHDYEIVNMDNTGDTHNLDQYAHSFDSSNTDSTLKGEASLGREHLTYYLRRDYLCPTEPLTKQALQALNHGNNLQQYDVQAWCQSNGCLPSAANMADARSASIMATKRTHQSKSHMTEAISSAWSVVHAMQAHPIADVLAENVCGAGCRFNEMATPPGHLSLHEDDLYD